MATNNTNGTSAPIPPGDGEWVYCRSFRHWRTGKRIFRKNGGYFRFRRRRR